MITEITLNGFASYKKPVMIEVEKRLSFFYGLNGTGKTALSSYLQEKEQEKDNAKYRHCSIKGGDGAKIFVYNSTFVRKNFYDNDAIKDVFTVGEENKKAEEAIEDANKKIESYTKKKQEREAVKAKQEKAKESAEETLEDEVWKIKGEFQNTALDFCLKGYKGDKKELCKKVKGTEIVQTEENTAALEREAKNLTGSDVTPKQEIPQISLDIDSIESNAILQEAITGTENSPLSELIKELDNADWVKQGATYLERSKSQCPFCQQSMDTSLTGLIKDYFDANYKSKVAQLNDLQSAYKGQKRKLPSWDSFKELISQEDDTSIVKDCLRKVEEEMEDNLRKIERKIESPSQTITLKRTSQTIDNLNNAIQTINQKIDEYNKTIADKKGTEEKIKSRFWKLMRREYNDSITNHDRAVRALKSDIDNFKKDIAFLDAEIEKQEATRTENLGKITNVEASIKKINKTLQTLSLEGFQIEKHGPNSYKIVRGNKSGEENEFWSLSEGEKTLISFLYFIELCKGTDDPAKSIDSQNRIIVIDDPVSSLSHNYIYDIAQLVQSEFLGDKYKQVFVLTHSLYFWSEVLRAKSDRELFRVCKYDGKTSINKMEENEILNNYQAYWQTIKDCKSRPPSNSSSRVHLANAMRNVLEYFFGFVGSDKNSQETMERLKKDCPAFVRYMNRESHYDAVNLDTQELDPARFQEAFKRVFKDCGHEKHYKKLMGEG